MESYNTDCEACAGEWILAKVTDADLIAIRISPLNRSTTSSLSLSFVCSVALAAGCCGRTTLRFWLLSLPPNALASSAEPLRTSKTRLVVFRPNVQHRSQSSESLVAQNIGCPIDTNGAIPPCHGRGITNRDTRHAVIP